MPYDLTGARWFTYVSCEAVGRSVGVSRWGWRSGPNTPTVRYGVYCCCRYTDSGGRKSILHVRNTNWRFVSNTDLIFLWHGFFMSHFIKEYPPLIVFFFALSFRRTLHISTKGEFKFYEDFFFYAISMSFDHHDGAMKEKSTRHAGRWFKYSIAHAVAG